MVLFSHQCNFKNQSIDHCHSKYQFFKMFSCKKKSRENAPLCCDGVESLICSPMLSNVTPETPCDKIDEPASSMVIEDDLRIGLQGWPVLSLGFSSGDITSANSSAVSSVKMLVSIFGFWKQQQCTKILNKIMCKKKFLER